MSRATIPRKLEGVLVKCRCGHIHSVEVEHYDRIIVDCGAPYFAVRPNAGGPLKLIPHPGPNLTRAEYLAKYGPEEET